jgi:hypothetical protein
MFFYNKAYYQELYILIIQYSNVVTPSGKMDVLKVKVDFKKPNSGSIPESPKVFISRF